MKKKYSSILYWLLLLSLLIYPHILANHILPFKNQAWTSTIINFIIISLTVSIYLFHEKQIDKIIKQKEKVEWNLEKSYQHIGVINWSIDIMKETIKQIGNKKIHQKGIIHKLSSIVKKMER